MYDERIFYFVIILQTEFHMFHIQILSKHSYTCTVTHHITTVIGTHITTTHIVTCTDIHNQSYTYTVTYHITIVIDTATHHIITAFDTQLQLHIQSHTQSHIT